MKENRTIFSFANTNRCLFFPSSPRQLVCSLMTWWILRNVKQICVAKRITINYKTGNIFNLFFFAQLKIKRKKSAEQCEWWKRKEPHNCNKNVKRQADWAINQSVYKQCVVFWCIARAFVHYVISSYSHIIITTVFLTDMNIKKGTSNSKEKLSACWAKSTARV